MVGRSSTSWQWVFLLKERDHVHPYQFPPLLCTQEYFKGKSKTMSFPKWNCEAPWAHRTKVTSPKTPYSVLLQSNLTLVPKDALISHLFDFAPNISSPWISPFLRCRSPAHFKTQVRSHPSRIFASNPQAEQGTLSVHMLLVMMSCAHLLTAAQQKVLP